MVLKFNGFEINAIHSGDAWKTCNLCVANEDRFKSYFPKTLEQNLTPTLSQIFVDNKVKAFKEKEAFLFTLKHSESRQLIGLIYIKELNWNSKQGEFAYCIDYNFEGQNLISKSIDLLSKYAFKSLGLETLQIIAQKTNIPSIKVAKKNNFNWVKTLVKGYTPPNAQPLDMELYELYNEK